MRKIFKIRGFLPFIVVLFINSVVDLGHKITIQNILVKTYSGDELIVLTAVVNLLILLPYISLFSLSGFLNDKFSRTWISRLGAAATIVFTFFITIAYFKGWFYFAFFMTLLLAIQSAIFSPAKYALIKQIAKKENLAPANSIVESATIIAILLSSLIFSMIFEKFVVASSNPSVMMSSIWFIGVILFTFTCLETYFAFKIPYFEAGNKNSKFNAKKYFKFGYLKENVTLIFRNKNILLSVLGVSVFWALAQLIIAVFPKHFKEVINSDNVAIIQMILASSTIGIVLGTLFSGYLSRKKIELGIVSIASFGLFSMLVLFASVNSVFWMFVVAILFGFMGGAFIIPLNSLIQLSANKENAGKIMAGSNFFQNIFMVIFLFLAIFCAYFSIKSTHIFYLASLSALFCSIVSFFILPNLTLRLFVMPFFKLFYKVRIMGEIPVNGGVMLLGNHLSFIDWALIQIAINRKVKFVMHVSFYEKLHIKWFFNLFDVIRVGKNANKSAIKQIQNSLKKGEVVAMFVEGHISKNSNLGEFKKGYLLATKDTGAKIVAFHIRGFWGSFFSKADISYKKKTFKRRVLNIAFSDVLNSEISPSALKKEVIKLSYFNLGDYLNLQKPLQYEWLKWAKRTPLHHSMVDFSGKTLSNFKVLVATLLFAKKLDIKGENIGILLPSSNACALVNLALLTQKKVIVNLNYTSNSHSLENSLENSGIKTILTSKKFVEKLKNKDISFSDKIKERFFYLENLEVSKFDKIKAFLKALLPKFMIEKLCFKKVNLDDGAAIIYSSGSEGEPKGVVLTHKNLLTNIVQVSDLLGRADIKVMLSSLPVFHSFGLTLTTLYPLYANLKSVFVADPTDGFSLGKMLEKHKAEVIFGTSTFFRLYTKNKKVKKEMFKSIKYTVAGGEKLNLNTKNDFEEKFYKEILEGYGTTETSPVISVNLPNETFDNKTQIFNKKGSVGMPLNGTIVKIVNPDTLEELNDFENGLILVGGHQVMKGYFNKQSDVLVEIGGVKYYKTGDIGHLDEDGFIYITDRISRFAKLGGEMVSLSMVENALHEVLSDDDIISATNLKDDKKGEKIVLLYEGDKTTDEIKNLIKSSNLNPLMRPTVIYKVDKIPVLGTGKVNFKGVKELASKLDE